MATIVYQLRRQNMRQVAYNSTRLHRIYNLYKARVKNWSREFDKLMETLHRQQMYDGSNAKELISRREWWKLLDLIKVKNSHLR